MPLESAQYFYDGDGTLVKSIVNGEVTYYVSRQFHLRVSGEETRIQKYYPFGGQPIAVRTQANGTDTLNWLLTDHLGSAQVTAAEGGAASGVQRYTAFGSRPGGSSAAAGGAPAPRRNFAGPTPGENDSRGNQTGCPARS